jgi:hypothetical protein
MYLSDCKEINSPKENQNRFKAPEFPSQIFWFNSKSPLKIKDLNGNIVLFYFWTYSNFDSQENIKELQKIQDLYENKILVILIHSGFFEMEKSNEFILNKILKLKINLLTINDPKFLLWRTFGISNYSSYVILNQNSEIITRQSLLPNSDLLKKTLKKLIDESLDLPTNSKYKEISNLEKNNFFDTILSFPDSITFTPDKKNLIVSDTGHNRILIINKNSGYIQKIIGTGEFDFKEGIHPNISFKSPLGLSADNENIYVADSENHLIRKFNFTTNSISTFIGNGEITDDDSNTGVAKVTPINQPKSIHLQNNTIYFTTTGLSQVWSVDTQNGNMKKINFPIKSSEFKPNSIVADDNLLYVGDSQNHLLFEYDLITNENKSIIGKLENNSNQFTAKQYNVYIPSSLFLFNNKIYISDSIDNKIKVYDRLSKQITTISGDGKSGFLDGSFPFNSYSDPSGLTIIDNEMYICDSNNHSIRILNLKDKNVKTFEIKFDKQLLIPKEIKRTNSSETEKFKSLYIKPNFNYLTLNLTPPKKYVWNRNIPFYFKIESKDVDIINFNQNNKEKFLENFQSEIDFNFLNKKKGSTEITIEGIAHFCLETQLKNCYYTSFQFSSFIKIDETGKDFPKINYEIKLEKKGKD